MRFRLTRNTSQNDGTVKTSNARSDPQLACKPTSSDVSEATGDESNILSLRRLFNSLRISRRPPPCQGDVTGRLNTKDFGDSNGRNVSSSQSYLDTNGSGMGDIQQPIELASRNSQEENGGLTAATLRTATLCRSGAPCQNTESVIRDSTMEESDDEEEIQRIPEIRDALIMDGPRKTIVLDLDDTLIWSEIVTNPPPEPWRHGIYTIHLDESELVPFNFKVHERPGARALLECLADHFELVVFTAGIKQYADKVIEFLDSRQVLIRRRFYRNHCLRTRCYNEMTKEWKTGYVKDLTIVRPQEDLGQILIIDDNWVSYNLHPENACPIAGWYPSDKEYPILDYTDRELFVLADFLRSKIFPLSDVRRPKSVGDQWVSDWVDMRRRAELSKAQSAAGHVQPQHHAISGLSCGQASAGNLLGCDSPAPAVLCGRAPQHTAVGGTISGA